MGQPIWVLLAELVAWSESDGTARSIELDAFDWGLRVDNLQYAVEVLETYETSGGSVRVQVDHYQSASGEKGYYELHSTAIAYFAPGTPLPDLETGSITSDRMPWGLPKLLVKDNTTTNPVGVRVRVWAGGKPAA